MKKWILRIMAMALTTAAMGNEVPPSSNMGEAPAYVERSGTALSMMGWGISIVVGIATLVCLVPNHKTTTSK